MLAMYLHKHDTILYPTVPPSQTAPETVSLLQQPVQNSKYASTIVIQGRSGYNREKSRSRVTHYPNQMTNSQYQNYGQTMSHNPVQVTGQSYDARSAPARQIPAHQIQYLQPNPVDAYKGKSASASNTRSFKMPSPPLVSGNNPQVRI